MLIFDSWPPKQGEVRFSEVADEVVFAKFQNRRATLTASRSIALFLRENCGNLDEAANIFTDLASEIPKYGYGDASNGVDDIGTWKPREIFIAAGSVVLGVTVEEAKTEGVTA